MSISKQEQIWPRKWVLNTGTTAGKPDETWLARLKLVISAMKQATLLSCQGRRYASALSMGCVGVRIPVGTIFDLENSSPRTFGDARAQNDVFMLARFRLVSLRN
ncbi:hypothetical protein N7G274_000777 [Stereocaulon virgatum]|uniref:Uncharacterized protein n=1 Tax=Stereocaulon virgatum TaxID=373712 RepID=A0ABR4APT9_9LECA